MGGSALTTGWGAKLSAQSASRALRENADVPEEPGRGRVARTIVYVVFVFD